MRIAYFDCFSGASGDMILGALVDAGLPLAGLVRELAALPVDGYQLSQRRVSRAGISGTKVDVTLSAAAQPQRALADLLDILGRSSLPAADRDAAARIFRALAEAEAQVHGVPVEQVHFHEVGAVDAIVDVVGAVVGLRLLGVEQVFVSALPLGGGTARAAHGRIPVPAPATLALLGAVSAPLRDGAGEPQMELVTPTGAAILTTTGRFGRPSMRLQAWGNGAGGRDLPDRPNMLRVLLGDIDETVASRTMVLAETNIDDMTGEAFGYAMERLLAAGAADVWFSAIQMKKNRPAVTLSVLCRPELEAAIVAVLLRETSTLGVRVQEVRRYEAGREQLTVNTSLGDVRVKVRHLPGSPPRVAPEFDDCRALALASGRPLMEVIERVTAEASRVIGEGGQPA